MKAQNILTYLIPNLDEIYDWMLLLKVMYDENVFPSENRRTERES